MAKILIITFSFIFQNISAECSDLSQAECEYWSGYCQWDADNNLCEELGGGGGGDGSIVYGPYEYGLLTELDGIRTSEKYDGALLYYPIGAAMPYKSIILIDAFGDEYGLQSWAQYYASHGFIGMTIGNDDETRRDIDSDWTLYDRADGLLDAKVTIKEENIRILSPLFNSIDTNSFAVSGYSTSGGGAHIAATMDSTLKAAILLNPAVYFLDSLNCDPEGYYFCLIEEHLDHEVPVLLFAGENELEGLVTPGDTAYNDVWALPQYNFVPETTDKLYFESANDGHGSASSPSGTEAKHALYWANYYLKNELNYCDSLIIQPENASQFLTTISCEQGPPPPPPEHNLGYLRRTDVSICMDECGMYYLESEEGEFLTNITNQNDIPNFDNYINRFVEIEGDTVQCVECTAKNVESIVLSSDCQNPVSCFVDPCTVGNCGSSNSANCLANYCGDCFADFYEDNALISCETPSGIQDLSGVDFGDCEMVLGFGWLNNHCGTISGCSFVVDSVNYIGALYSSLFDCISASTLDVDELNPVNFYLSQNYPNPLTQLTNIAYELAYGSHVKIAIHDMNGRLIRTLVDHSQSPGYKNVIWDGKDNQSKTVAAGVYIYTIEAGSFRSMKKMLFLK